MSKAKTGSGPAAAPALARLRRFHLGGPDDGTLPAAPGDLLPAHLHPFRDPVAVRTDYPLFVGHDDGAGLPVCDPIADRLRAAAGESRLLQDNLGRIERVLRERLTAGARPALRDALAESGTALADRLKLAEEQDRRLRDDWTALVDGLPDGELMVLDASTPLRLALAAVRSAAGRRRRDCDAELVRLRDGLRALLRVEREKDPGAHEGSALAATVGSAGAAMLDPGALAQLLGPHRGSVRLDARRRARVEHALGELEVRLDRGWPSLLTVVHARGAGPALGEEGVTLAAADDPCAAAAERFDAAAADCAALFRAMRTAELELASRYDPDRHDPWLDALDWEGYSTDELLLVPAVLALDDAERLAGAGMASLSRLLRSGRPVQVVAVAAPGGNPAAGADALSTFRLELGYLGIGHREAFVQQSSAARPAHLVEGFALALRRPRAALHVVDAVGDDGGLGAWLRAGAAIESRAHPLFRYDPDAGATWARRLDFAGNPAIEEDWSGGELAVPGSNGAQAQERVAFTFADYALLEPALAAEFRPTGDVGDQVLVPIADFLELDPAAAEHKIPFVRAIDPAGAAVQLAVTRRLVAACRDRLDFWRTLQELAGVRNEHVREAVERARAEAAERFAAEREGLEAAHRQELERVRAAAVDEAMAGLARSLLELGPQALDLGTARASAPRPAVAEPAPAPPEPAGEPAAEPAAEPEPEADGGFDEPWIDTALCTSCNDCRNINPLVFVYDENKQARIGDPRAGKFAELVLAAEKCPARCIHPGKPLDPSEPNLDELVARAAPFNG